MVTASSDLSSSTLRKSLSPFGSAFCRFVAVLIPVAMARSSTSQI